MQIQTTRFGLVAVDQSDLITMTEGILGFGNLKKFVILEDPDDLIFAWLQSCENPAIAFPVLEPELFSAEYSVKLTKSDREALSLQAEEHFRIFTIVTIPADATLMTANLKAPVIVNTARRVAKQIVTQDNDHPIKHPIFTELQRRLVTGATAGQTAAKVSVRLEKRQTVAEDTGISVTPIASTKTKVRRSDQLI